MLVAVAVACGLVAVGRPPRAVKRLFVLAEPCAHGVGFTQAGVEFTPCDLSSLELTELVAEVAPAHGHLNGVRERDVGELESSLFSHCVDNLQFCRHGEEIGLTSLPVLLSDLSVDIVAGERLKLRTLSDPAHSLVKNKDQVLAGVSSHGVVL